MKLPRLEYRALSVLSKLSNRPSRSGQFDNAVLYGLIKSGLVIRYKTIFLITSLGVATLQHQPLRRFVARFVVMLGLGDRSAAVQSDTRGPVLVWRA